jgi:2-polyprenyl-3-methyl-5-hydroxy-6-metoxy-1,4-benzoquinol methylase
MEEQHRHTSKEFRPFLPHDKDSKILEIGAGYGPFLYTLEQLGYSNVQGIDLSSEQVKVAAELGLDVKKEEALAFLSTQKQSFDLIIGIDIIEHLDRDELVELIPLIREALKPGGGVIFRVPNLDAPFSSVYAHADLTHETYFNKSSALQLFRAGGFQTVDVSPSLIRNQKPLREVIRRLLWKTMVFRFKLGLFASGRTWNDVVFTPNLIITAKR